MTSRSLVEGFRRVHKRSLGQNFLLDDSICEKICDAAKDFEPLRFIEIGPGAGALTLALLKTGLPCHCIEKDDHCSTYLRRVFAQTPQFSLTHADALHDEIAALHFSADQRVVLVSNLPYNVSTQIYFRMIDEELPFLGMVLMFQREVGQRFMAKPSTKAYGILSVLGQYYHDIESVIEVEPSAFKPAPKVHSLVLRFTPRVRLLEPALEASFRSLVHAAFGQRRKTLANSLNGFKGVNKAQWQKRFETLGFDPHIRAENLSLEQFLELFRASH